MISVVDNILKRNPTKIGEVEVGDRYDHSKSRHQSESHVHAIVKDRIIVWKPDEKCYRWSDKLTHLEKDIPIIYLGLEKPTEEQVLAALNWHRETFPWDFE